MNGHLWFAAMSPDSESDHDEVMSTLSNFLPAELPGREITLEDVRSGDPVLVISETCVAIGYFDCADFTAEDVTVYVTKNDDEDVNYSMDDIDANAISIRLLDAPMTLTDLIGERAAFVVHRDLIGRTAIWEIDDVLLSYGVIGYVGYGYGEDGDVRVALDKEPLTEGEIPDTYALLEIVR